MDGPRRCTHRRLAPTSGHRDHRQRGGNGGRYRETSAWTGLSLATRRQRENIFENVLKSAGREPFTKITTTSVMLGRDRRAATPAQARNFLDAMRGLFRWAVKAKLVKSDPTAGVDNPRPLTKESFGNLFRKACREAGLQNRSAHGLRKAAATRAANAGATVAQLEAIFGWNGGTMASLYTRTADRRRLALEAMFLLSNE
jgi:site-specific recombinase XerD